ncbi:hypothetical protein ACIQXI_09810 [Lysinibacillus sp. NPDC097195]|uniref:hypothetical protein n=1 Tax=Lysinibacillus sp. NPDC097195 TaxID=3364141 RepID=UPI0037FA574E
MRYSVLLSAFVVMLLFPCKAMATSWAYPFVVWDDYIYVVSDEYVENIDKVIGKVTKYSDMEQYEGNFSNVYSKGTKYYSIKGIDTGTAIAIQEENGQYIKAFREGEYTYQKSYLPFVYKGLGAFAILIVGLMVFTLKNNYNAK